MKEGPDNKKRRKPGLRVIQGGGAPEKFDPNELLRALGGMSIGGSNENPEDAPSNSEEAESRKSPPGEDEDVE